MSESRNEGMQKALIEITCLAKKFHDENQKRSASYINGFYEGLQIAQRELEKRIDRQNS